MRRPTASIESLKYERLKYERLKYEGLKYEGLKYEDLKHERLKHAPGVEHVEHAPSTSDVTSLALHCYDSHTLRRHDACRGVDLFHRRHRVTGPR
ncbi:MAG: hypothetical protein RL591_1840 [Planctomycetota bacterium]